MFLPGKISSFLVDILDIIKIKCLKNTGDYALRVLYQPHLLFSFLKTQINYSHLWYMQSVFI